MRSRRTSLALARTLRREMSLPEVLLWQALRGRKFEGMRFRRQQPIGPYVADFYCGACRLVIEVDGQSHHCDDRFERDEVRDRWMTERGFGVLRLPASVVLGDMDSAVMTILAAINDRANPPSGRIASRGWGTAADGGGGGGGAGGQGFR